MDVATPKVSVIIPAYNAEKYLKKCLDSVIKQTLRDIQIICVDDGSTDNTGTILDEYSTIEDRIVVIHQENNGQSAARNKGMEVAVGEYIGFVDSDDFIDERMFESMYERAQKYNSDIVITNMYLYINSTGELAPYRDIVRLFHLEREEAFLAKDYPDVLKLVGVWDKLYRRRFLEDYHLRYLQGKIYEDHLFSYQALILAKRISVLSEPLYYYRKNAGESITDKEIATDKHKQDYLTIIRKIQDFLIEQGVYDSFTREFLDYKFEFALFHQSNIRDRSFFEYFFNEIRSMTSDKDLKIIQEHGLPRHKWYADRLEKNEFQECFKTLRKNHISIYDL